VDRDVALQAHVVFNVDQLRQHLEYLHAAQRQLDTHEVPLGREMDALQFLLEELSPSVETTPVPGQVSF
jgi:hypothetical protein